MISELSTLLTLTVADRQRIAILQTEMAAGGEPSARAFLEACRLVGEAADPLELDTALPGSAASVVERTGALVAAVFSMVSRRFASRQDAQSARAALAARADFTIEDAGNSFGADMHAFLVRLTGDALLALSREAANRAPLVRVEVGASLPSSLLAFDLYGDPSRGEEIVSRNQVGTPFLMPIAFEAQAT